MFKEIRAVRAFRTAEWGPSVFVSPTPLTCGVPLLRVHSSGAAGGEGSPGLKAPGSFRRAAASSWQTAWGEQALFPPLQTIPEGRRSLKYVCSWGWLRLWPWPGASPTPSRQAAANGSPHELVH